MSKRQTRIVEYPNLDLMILDDLFNNPILSSHKDLYTLRRLKTGLLNPKYYKTLLEPIPLQKRVDKPEREPKTQSECDIQLEPEREREESFRKELKKWIKEKKEREQIAKWLKAEPTEYDIQSEPEEKEILLKYQPPKRHSRRTVYHIQSVMKVNGI